MNKFDHGKKNKWMSGLIIVLMCLGFAAACAEPMGFGFVNAKDVALRRGIGGKKVLARLPKNTCVWIHGSETDQKGTEWFHVNAGMKIKGGSYDYTGWMKAEFIDAGEKVWNNHEDPLRQRLQGVRLLYGEPVPGKCLPDRSFTG